jgi:hypothetical protein
MMLPVRLTV